MIKKNFRKSPVIFPSLTVSFIYILILSFYISPKYDSESIISVSSGDSGSVSSALGFVSSFLGSGIDQSIGDLKAYLESDNAAEDIQEIIDITSIYSKKNIDFFSRYRPDSDKKLKEYLKKNIVLKADTSGNLIINTSAFKPDDALKVNLAVIMLSSNYFDKRQTLSSKLAMQKHICQFELSKDGFPEINIKNLLKEDKKESIRRLNIDDYKSANTMLLSKADLYMNLCQPILDKNLNTDIGIPANTLRDLNNESIKQLIGNIYSNSISTLTMSDAIEILAEPTLNKKSKNKEIILNSIIVFIFSIMFSTTVRIISKLRYDFRF